MHLKFSYLFKADSILKCVTYFSIEIWKALEHECWIKTNPCTYFRRPLDALQYFKTIVSYQKYENETKPFT